VPRTEDSPASPARIPIKNNNQKLSTRDRGASQFGGHVVRGRDGVMVMRVLVAVVVAGVVVLARR